MSNPYIFWSIKIDSLEYLFEASNQFLYVFMQSNARKMINKISSWRNVKQNLWNYANLNMELSLQVFVCLAT